MKKAISFLLLCTLSLGVAGSLFAGESTEKARTVRDFGAVGDGKADDTAALQQTVDERLGDVRLPRGVYRITKPIVVELDRVGPTSIVGTGTPRIVMAGPGPALKFVGTHGGTAAPHTVKPNVWNQRMPVVEGLEIVGAHPEACGIEATGTMKLIVTRVTVRKALHGIHLTKRNRNVIISDCHLYENRGVGVFLDNLSMHQINLSACHISYNLGGGVVSRAGDVRNLHITGCDIEGNMAPGQPPTANVLIDCTDGAAGTAEIAIVGCTIQHTHTAPDSANIRYIGADAKGRLWGNFSIADNVISDAQFNIDIAKARGVTIVGNTFWGAAQDNLRVVDSYNIAVGVNAFDRNPGYSKEVRGHNALMFRNCRDCTLTGLHVNGTAGVPAGLILEKCRRMNVTDCTVLDCAGAGILLREVSDSRVSDCLVRNDRDDAGAWTALKAVGGRGNMISDNLFGGPIEVEPDTAKLDGNVAH